MKILLHGLNFSPEEIGIGKYSGEMVSALAEAGHEVVVVTTPPYYPPMEDRRGILWFRLPARDFKWQLPAERTDGTGGLAPFR